MMLLLLPGVLAAVAAAAAEYAAPPGLMPPTNPPWEPTWDLARSTITMTCNGSGWSDPALGAQFGIVSYDWSNAKTQWAAAKPMDCEKRLQTQARMTKAANNETHVFGYRNVVKALPWFGSVREKLDDPAYSGWFLRFDPEQVASKNTSVPPCAAEDQQKCSVYYHDQEQVRAPLCCSCCWPPTARLDFVARALLSTDAGGPRHEERHHDAPGRQLRRAVRLRQPAVRRVSLRSPQWHDAARLDRKGTYPGAGGHGRPRHQWLLQCVTRQVLGTRLLALALNGNSIDTGCGAASQAADVFPRSVYAIDANVLAWVRVQLMTSGARIYCRLAPATTLCKAQLRSTPTSR